MPQRAAIFTPEIFRFFRQLARNNHKPWMDANRGRYEEHVVAPFRALLETLTPALIEIDPSFDVHGLTGVNFTRINRDIRFRPDVGPYHAHMYLTIVGQGVKGRTAGQLYAGISAKTVTVGFRIYGEKKKEGPLAEIAVPRALKHGAWLEKQKQRLGGKYKSYWYAMEKGEWNKKEGWPLAPEEWNKIRGWIVRREMQPSVVTRPRFAAEIARTFRDLYPLYVFASQPGRKPE
ncbi:MAG TPA: DUF2461 family protein [Candidatus Acidoferrales bacterium]|nr:DUF2461 family protein [Candidatus Acidoferrales bacterium]